MHILGQVAHMPQHQDYDSFVCILVSRGGSQSVFGVDQTHSGVPLDHIRRMFMADACPSLSGKPKVFFIQNYVTSESQLEDSSFLEVDRPSVKSAESKVRQPGACVIHREADFFWSLCKADVSLLERSSPSPSLYLKCLSQKLGKERWATQAVVDPGPSCLFSATRMEVPLCHIWCPFLQGEGFFIPCWGCLRSMIIDSAQFMNALYFRRSYSSQLVVWIFSFKIKKCLFFLITKTIHTPYWT